jgi:hypothetical protein
MRKTWILVVVLTIIILLSGFTAADRGIDPVAETQGITTITVIDASGNFDSNSDLSWKMTDDLKGLEGIPPLGDSSEEGSIQILGRDPLQVIATGVNEGATLYSSVYTEKTNSNGVGTIGYTKTLDVDTQAKLTGQSNIKATKQIDYIAQTGGSISSVDFISVGGTGNPSPSAHFGLAVNTDVPPLSSGNGFSCVFGGCCGSGIVPAFCNYAESESSIDMSVAHATTTSDVRFVVPSADTPVVLDHDIRVTDSVGKGSAGFEASINEGSPAEQLYNYGLIMYNPETLDYYVLEGWLGISSTNKTESIDVSEHTSIDGSITLFDKDMRYESGANR